MKITLWSINMRRIVKGLYLVVDFFFGLGEKKVDHKGYFTESFHQMVNSQPMKVSAVQAFIERGQKDFRSLEKNTP